MEYFRSAPTRLHNRTPRCKWPMARWQYKAEPI